MDRGNVWIEFPILGLLEAQHCGLKKKKTDKLRYERELGTKTLTHSEWAREIEHAHWTVQWVWSKFDKERNNHNWSDRPELRNVNFFQRDQIFLTKSRQFHLKCRTLDYFWEIHSIYGCWRQNFMVCVMIYPSTK